MPERINRILGAGNHRNHQYLSAATMTCNVSRSSILLDFQFHFIAHSIDTSCCALSSATHNVLRCISTAQTFGFGRDPSFPRPKEPTQAYAMNVSCWYHTWEEFPKLQIRKQTILWSRRLLLRFGRPSTEIGCSIIHGRKVFKLVVLESVRKPFPPTHTHRRIPLILLSKKRGCPIGARWYKDVV